MGARGPHPRPTKLKILQGHQKSRTNFDEPVAPESRPQCPPEVSQPVREVWEYTCDQLQAMGISSPADRDALLAYCEAVIVHRNASALLARSQILIKNANSGNLMRNPVLQIQRDSARLIAVFAQHFGLTPSARSEIRNPKGASGGGAERYLTA